MPKNPVFDLARGKATPELIMSYFSSPDAYMDGDEYWTRNPLRGDGSVGSFSINVCTGMWSDFASDDKGDLINLLVESGRAPSKLKAAEIIVNAIGGILLDDQPAQPVQKSTKPPKIKAVIPIPNDALLKLEARVKGKWAIENRGTAVKSWAWRLPSGEAWCCTTRYQFYKKGNDKKIIPPPPGESETQKDVIPHYWGEDGKWHEGDPMDSGRHLYRVDQILKAPRGTKFLIVEGEKKASIRIEGKLLTTWIGGAKVWDKTDWSPLEQAARDGDVDIWPDADKQYDKHGNLIPWAKQPGMAAALGIARRLPGAKILDVENRANSNGWALDDAVAEGIDPVAFIESCPKIGGDKPIATASVRPDDNWPFLCLGYDKSQYYFMRKDRRTLMTISMGSFNTSKLGELAPLSWWTLAGHVSDQGTIKAATAQDMIVACQQEIGFFDIKKIRGAGVWRDQDGIILNDGRRIVTMDGKAISYQDYKSSFFYVPSQVHFGEMYGPESTDQDGRELEELFKALEFEEQSMGPLLMGWCLLAPFGGVLNWRPQGWVTGKAGSGKSWAVENICIPIAGPFSHIGSGKDTEAGFRWALDQDARPAFLKEMEGENEGDRKKVASLVNLIRNLSDDSGQINISQAGGGTKTFNLRSMCLLSSKVAPPSADSISSRFTIFEMARSKDEKAKNRKCEKMAAELLDDPGRFRRRIFHALPRIIADIEFLRSNYIGVFGSQRAIDQFAPMMATAWAAQSTKSIRESGVWLDRMLSELAQESKRTVDDEDAFMAQFVAIGIKDDDNHVRTIAELMERVYRLDDNSDKALHLLERHGITLRRWGGIDWTLSIASRLPKLAELFRDTIYGDAYGDQVKRCRFTKQKTTRPIRMKCGKPRCFDLEWDGFADAYLGSDSQQELDMADDKIPF